MLWNNDKLVERHYFTFWEAIHILQASGLAIYPGLDGVTDDDDHKLGITEIVQKILDTTDHYIVDPFICDDTTSRTMFNEYLWPEFCHSYILYVDKERSLWEAGEDVSSDDIANWFFLHGLQWVRWLRESKDRYEPLITNLETIKTKLMDHIGSQSVTLFNDTPQNGGNFVLDPYTTNATKSTTESDVATPIARLKEVQDLLRNYYADWANEFSRVVIESAEGLE